MIGCADQCGAQIQDYEQDALQAGWTHLTISNRWRCPNCMTTLQLAGRIVGTDGVTKDRLPPGSRGALPKETASTNRGSDPQGLRV